MKNSTKAARIVLGGVYEEKEDRFRWLLMKVPFEDKYVFVRLEPREGFFEEGSWTTISEVKSEAEVREYFEENAGISYVGMAKNLYQLKRKRK